MRAIWKGAVSFGLVNVPVRLYSATENHDVQFRQVHREDGGRIKYKRTCSIDGEEVSYDDIAKGYETEDGDMVVLTDEDFADLPSASSKEIGVTKFVMPGPFCPMHTPWRPVTRAYPSAMCPPPCSCATEMKRMPASGNRSSASR